MGTRENVLALKVKQAKRIELQGKEFFVRMLSASEMLGFQDYLKTATSAEQHTRLLVLGLSDSEGNRVFTDDESNLVGELPQEVTVAIQNEILTFNKLYKGAVEEAEKK